MRFGLSLQIVKRMDNEIKKKVKSFLQEYGLQNVTLENLRSVIQKQGYTVVEYNNIFNDENVAALIDALGLENFCERSKGFTYADTKRRLVFLHEDLSDKEKVSLLGAKRKSRLSGHFRPKTSRKCLLTAVEETSCPSGIKQS